VEWRGSAECCQLVVTVINIVPMYGKTEIARSADLSASSTQQVCCCEANTSSFKNSMKKPVPNVLNFQPDTH
jgi:hypothetical protein